MDLFHQTFLKLIKKLNQAEVKYIVVGGFSTNFHGYHRATADVDLWLKDSKENRSKLIKALSTLGLGDLEPLSNVPMIPGYCDILLSHGIYLDLMDRIMGFDQNSFDECYESSVIASIEDTTIRFLHLNHLLESKKNSHRVKDQDDYENLKVIHNLK